MLLDMFYTLFSWYLTSVGSGHMLFIIREQITSQKVRRTFPYIKGELKGTVNLELHERIGEGPFAILQLVAHLVFGWPAYLLTGATGGSARGVTNHFIPSINTGPIELFPGSWKKKVWFS
jgi:hypothetical protein